MEWLDDERYFIEVPDKYQKCKVCDSRLDEVKVQGLHGDYPGGQFPKHYFKYVCGLKISVKYRSSTPSTRIKEECQDQTTPTQKEYS